MAAADPLFSIAGTMDQSRDYGRVLEAFDAADADATSLTLFWDMLEVGGVYQPEPDWPAIANASYPQTGLQISLMISVIDTVADRRPADLQALPFSDPVVIARFDAFLSSVLRAMPDIRLTSIGIGNEVDGYLRGGGWEDYGAFFVAAKRVAVRERPGVPVGMTLTWGGLRDNPQAQALARRGDVWMINHYPLASDFSVLPVAQTAVDLDAMLQLASPQQVYLTETGYPSGGCDATETGQRDYVVATWDFAQANARRMPLVNFVWLHDLSEAEVASYTSYYGVRSDCFARYLATLGLRTLDGRDKPAFAWMRNR
ncbi:MAG: hypothetical protein AAFU41_18625 [Pseudomonadota bacterium]